MAGPARALGGALLMAALMTLGDFVWARFITDHRALYGLIHGACFCLGIGLYLGALRGRALRGALAGPAIGLAAAAGYYALAMVLGYAAMFVMWMALWAAFGLLYGRLLGEPRTSTAEALVRGALAAVGSGIGFYAISGIWTRHGPGPPNYAYNYFCWTLALLPGFLALLVGYRASPPRP